MARIKRVAKTGGTAKIKQTRMTPIGLRSELATKKLKSTSKRKRDFGATKPLNRSVQEIVESIKDTLKLLEGDKTIEKLLLASDVDRVRRAREQLSVFALRSARKDVFKFVVKASGLHLKTSYQVEVRFDDAERLRHLDYKDVFKQSHVSVQCSCEDFKYRYRYIATKGKFVLGANQYVKPTITNPNLKGALCKHIILVFMKMEKPAFMNVFKRYIEAKRVGKHIRVNKKDTLSTIASSSRSKI